MIINSSSSNSIPVTQISHNLKAIPIIMTLYIQIMRMQMAMLVSIKTLIMVSIYMEHLVVWVHIHRVLVVTQMQISKVPFQSSKKI